MILQSNDGPGERRRTGRRPAAVLLAAVTGLTSGLARAAFDWLLEHVIGS
jgi:hypothetical protein